MPWYWVNYNIHISLKHKYVYVENPKVACTTIKDLLHKHELGLLYDKFGPKPIHRDSFGSPMIKPFQLSDRELKHVLSSPEFFKFTFVRDPYSRLLSCYLEKVKRKNQCIWLLYKFTPSLGENISFQEFVDTIELMTPFQMDSHWRIQKKQIFYDDIEFDFIGRFEKFDEDFAYVKQKLFIDVDLSLRRDSHKVDTFTQLDSYYDADNLDKVLDIYKEDFVTFNYANHI